MTYEYTCSKCEHNFDVIKPVREMENEELCPKCNSQGVRHFFPRKILFNGTKVQEAEYNPGLGCVVRNKQHREELAKRHNLVEIGNDFSSAETMQKHFDTQREIKRQREWDEL